jgi:hypothetical protein
MNLIDCLCGLFRPGSGRRRVHANHAAAVVRLAELEAVAAEHDGCAEVLECASAKYAELQAWNARLVEETLLTRELLAGKEKELSILQGILDALEVPVDESGSVPQPALADDPESWIHRPFPPVPYRRIVDIPPGPVGSEAADVCAETQQTDVRALRAAVAAIPDAGPVTVSWDGGLSTRPPLPDEAPTERLSAITAVLPVWDRTITVDLTKPVELSPITAARAQENVLAAVGATP